MSSADPSLAQIDNVPRMSRWSWFSCGMLVGVLLIGTANALFFFVRSEGWGSLLGERVPGDEAIGFPMLVWQEGAGYGSHHLKAPGFFVNIFCGLLVGSAVGGWAIVRRKKLNRLVNGYLNDAGASQSVQLQFSLRGLLITTFIAATAAAIARVFTPRTEILAGIYIAGPSALVLMAYAPSRLSWQQRCTIIAPLSLALIAVAITLGTMLGMEFDKVLMGIFICWTPQCVLAACALTAVLIVKANKLLTDQQDLAREKSGADAQ